MNDTDDGTTVWNSKLPALVDLRTFHDIAHEIAGMTRPPHGLSTHDVGQMIKTKILCELPPEYFEHRPAEGIEVFCCNGTFDFPTRIPREVMLRAMEAAGMIVAADENEIMEEIDE